MADSEEQCAVFKAEAELRSEQESQRAAFRAAAEAFMEKHDDLMRLLAA